MNTVSTNAQPQHVRDDPFAKVVNSLDDVLFASFPRFEKIRVTSFGHMVESSAIAGSSMEIEVYFANLSDCAFAEKDKGLIDPPIRMTKRPIGELALLYLNAILCDRSLATESYPRLGWEIETQKVLNFNRSNITVFGRHDKDESGNPIIPLRLKWLGSHLDASTLFIAIGEGDDKYAYIVPSVIVLIFFYICSDTMAKSIFNGDFLRAREKLWCPKTSCIDENGKAQLHLRRGVPTVDAPFLARFAFDDYALSRVIDIFTYYAKNQLDGGKRPIKALPPIQGQVNCNFLCREFTTDSTKKRHLITRFIRCDWLPPFSELFTTSDNPRGEADDKENKDKKGDDETGEDTKQPLPRKRNGPTPLSGQKPNSPIVTAKIVTPEIGDRFPRLQLTYKGHVASPRNTPQTKRGNAPSSLEFKTFSVAEGQSTVITSEDIIGRAAIRAAENAPPPPKQRSDAVGARTNIDALSTYIELLELVEKVPDTNVQYRIAMDQVATLRGVDLNRYPDEVYDKRRRWLFMDRDQKKTRMALLAEITHEGKTRYLLELQRKRNRECSTLIFWSRGEHPIVDDLLRILMLDCAYYGSAKLGSAKSFGIIWARLKHPSKPMLEEKFAARMVNRIFYKIRPLKSG